MCGIFGLVLKNEYDVQSDYKTNMRSKNISNMARSVVRNIQVLKTLIHKLYGDFIASVSTD